MVGFELKAEVVRNGLLVWKVAERAEIPYYKVSAIFSGRIAPTPNEVAAIRRAIFSLSKQGEKEGVA